MRILAVDQSLANTGLVWVESDPLQVTAKGMLKSRGLLSGNEATLRRAEEMVGEFDALLSDDIDLVLFEVPPLGNLVQRPESSLLSALALRVAARKKGKTCVGVNTNKAKKFLTGSAQARKPKVREALLEKYPQFAGLNQHQTDAVSLAVTYLYDH